MHAMMIEIEATGEIESPEQVDDHGGVRCKLPASNARATRFPELRWLGRARLANASLRYARDSGGGSST